MKNEYFLKVRALQIGADVCEACAHFNQIAKSISPMATRCWWLSGALLIVLLNAESPNRIDSYQIASTGDWLVFDRFRNKVSVFDDAAFTAKFTKLTEEQRA